MSDEAFARPVSRTVTRLLPGPCGVEANHVRTIEDHWRAAIADKPKMFNGRILLGERVTLDDDVLRVDFREVAFATLLWLRGEGSETGLFNVFGAAAVVSRDGAALLGRMAPHTANAGQVYFPCGTPDLGDILDGAVDLEGSIERELAEETGLRPPVARATARSVVVFDGRIVGLIRRFDTDLDAGELAARVTAHLASEQEPELDRIVLARASRDLGPEAPRYARIALDELLKD